MAIKYFPESVFLLKVDGFLDQCKIDRMLIIEAAVTHNDFEKN